MEVWSQWLIVLHLELYCSDEFPSVILSCWLDDKKIVWPVKAMDFIHLDYYPEQHTHTQLFNGLLSRTTRVGRYRKKTFTHSHPSWSSDILYQLPPFTTIHGIFFVQFTSLTVFSDNLSSGPLWSSSWPWTLNFILHAFLRPIIIIFLQHMPIPTQPVLLQYQCYVIYT